MKKNYIFTLLMTICMTVASFGQYSDLFISMYAEGSSNNKFIEIYNGTGSDIDLSNYMIKGTNNGGDWKESRNLNLTGIITAGDVYVISTEDADASILAVADLSLSYDSPVHYNGDDAIALLKKNDSDVFEVIDIIGATGDDPGSGWAVAGVTNATKDHTLTRKNTISGPSSDWSSAGSDESSSQWVVTGKDTEWTSLGSYTAFIASTDPMDDFEGNGNITWAADGETGMDIAFANPSSTGINTSATVLEYTDAGGSDALKYANINFDLSTDTSIKYDLSTKNVFTLKVFVPTPDVAVTTGKTLALKLQDHSSSSPWEGQQVVSVAYEYDVWQELVFDFSAQSGATNFSRIVVQFNGENNTEAVKGYIDDLSYGEAVVADPTLPSVASPAVSASITGGTAGTNYISIYSDDLTSIAVDDLNPNWNQATSASEIQIDGDNTLRYANLNYQGTTFNNDKQDVSGMTHLHIDYHTTNSTELQFFLIVDGVEEAYDIKANEGITTGSWVSLDIPLSNWTIDLATLREIKVVGNGTIYFDNWYFYDGATANVDSNNLLGFSMYPNPASNSLNISATETIQNAEIYNILGKNVMSVNVNDTKVTLDISNLASGMYIVKYKANDKIGTAKFIKK